MTEIREKTASTVQKSSHLDTMLAQSVLFLLKALRRSKEIGMDQAKIKKTIKTAALFTIAPAVSIVISVITLSKSLGIPLPWLRLSVAAH